MKISRLALLPLILSLPTIADAQSDDENELKLYDVEVVIFKNLQVPKGKELILPVSSPVSEDDIFDLSSPESIKAAEEKFYHLLPPEQLRLLDKVTNIIESPYYELLTHIGWRQPGVEKEQALPIWVRGGKIYGDEYVSIDSQMPANTQGNSNSQSLTGSTRGNFKKLYEMEGKITIALSRYLHVYTDLVLRQPRLIIDETPQQDNQEITNTVSGNSSDLYTLDNYSLKDRRRMRSKTLHYLDNPEFALLVLITPYKPEEALPDSAILTQ